MKQVSGCGAHHDRIAGVQCHTVECHGGGHLRQSSLAIPPPHMFILKILKVSCRIHICMKNKTIGLPTTPSLFSSGTPPSKKILCLVKMISTTR